MGMTDREKVIEELEMSYNYSNADENNTLVPQWIVLHAIALLKEDERAIKHQSDHLDALLKAQEPRVVKMSELTAGEPMLVWLEDIDKEETVAGMIFDYVPGRLGFKLTDIVSRDRIYPRIEDYLTRWRCWTSRPDKATREATPWNV